MLEVKSIGNKIAEARKKSGISQAQLAGRMFISPQAVGKWERGESMPDIVTFNRLAAILGVDLNYFSENPQGHPDEREQQEVMSVQKTPYAEKEPENRPGWDMSCGNWVDADFSGLKNLQEKFNSSNMQRCLFIGSELSGIQLKYNHVDGCDFSGSLMDNSLFSFSHLENSQFKNCSLRESEFSVSHIRACDFSGADLSGMTIKTGTFEKIILDNTTLNRCSFVTSQLSDILFGGRMQDCRFENCAFTRVSFQNVTFINSFFKNKSLKRIRFIDCRADRLTYAFLKSGKADMAGISLLEE